MWARIMGSQLVEIIHQPKAMTINNVQYPKSIFGLAWTNEERKAIGREQDNGTAKPADLAKWRTDLRAKAVALETAIDDKSDVAGLEAMTVFTEEMRDAGKKASEFNDWPVNPREPVV
jgi:hypothetical protein